MKDYRILDKVQELFNKDEYLQICRGATVLRYDFGSVDIESIDANRGIISYETEIKELQDEVKDLEIDLKDSENEIFKKEMIINNLTEQLEKLERQNKELEEANNE